MEIVTVERKTFETMLETIRALTRRLAALQRKCDGKRLDEWLSGEEVCQRLRISRRTLQTLRDKRFIGHTQMNRKFYYRTEDVKAILPIVKTINR